MQRSNTASVSDNRMRNSVRRAIWRNIGCQKTWQHLFKVHLAPKYFLLLNKSLHLFETHCDV